MSLQLIPGAAGGKNRAAQLGERARLLRVLPRRRDLPQGRLAGARGRGGWTNRKIRLGPLCLPCLQALEPWPLTARRRLGSSIDRRQRSVRSFWPIAPRAAADPIAAAVAAEQASRCCGRPNNRSRPDPPIRVSRPAPPCRRFARLLPVMRSPAPDPITDSTRLRSSAPSPEARPRARFTTTPVPAGPRRRSSNSPRCPSRHRRRVRRHHPCLGADLPPSRLPGGLAAPSPVGASAPVPPRTSSKASSASLPAPRARQRVRLTRTPLVDEEEIPSQPRCPRLRPGRRHPRDRRSDRGPRHRRECWPPRSRAQDIVPDSRRCVLEADQDVIAAAVAQAGRQVATWTCVPAAV